MTVSPPANEGWPAMTPHPAGISCSSYGLGIPMDDSRWQSIMTAPPSFKAPGAAPDADDSAAAKGLGPSEPGARSVTQPWCTTSRGRTPSCPTT